MTNVQAQAEKFTKLIENAGVEMNAENVLKCIGYAKLAMQNGECSVEAYYAAKRILLEKLEVANVWVN